jgi:hypothetical protein
LLLPPCVGVFYSIAADIPSKKGELALQGANSPQIALAVAVLATHVLVLAMTALLLAGAFAVALILLAGATPVALVLLLILTVALTFVAAFLRIFVGIDVRHMGSSTVVERR